MAKTKWIEMHLGLGVRALAARLAESAFTLDRGLGFELLEVRNKRIEARFIERFIQRETLEDPFGEVRHVESVRYNIFRFYLLAISSGHYLIVLIDPPRSVKSFVTILSDAVEAGMSIEALRFDVLTLLNVLRVAPDVGNLIVRKVKAVGDILGGHASARLELQSLGNATDDLHAAFPKFSAVIERVCFQFVHEGSEESGELSASGTLAVSEHLIDTFVALLVPALCAKAADSDQP
ncbi:hypothetical protein [Burkholderia glumae]|uniref:hypothetical protein n=1 Tax=Burkholderia glumae TaxID=337 RepID=UPI00148EB71F|nr:hypothetical protein [Burkholderia glumae]MCQ0034201.1 hypothetical protein [Burkholderia glumae]MCQ0038129.1 hypothetical protein [Burkholderia glumae]QJW80616.1 hypothetical protein GAS18_17815 [Burkholderia glumae]